MKGREWVWIGVTHDGKGSFIDGVEGDFRGWDWLSLVINDSPQDFDDIAGSGFTLSGLEFDLESRFCGVNVEFTISQAELWLGVLAFGVSGPFDD